MIGGQAGAAIESIITTLSRNLQDRRDIEYCFVKMKLFHSHLYKSRVRCMYGNQNYNYPNIVCRISQFNILSGEPLRNGRLLGRLVAADLPGKIRGSW